MEELKKEFYEKYAVKELVDVRNSVWMPSPEFPSEQSVLDIWQFIEENTVPKSELEKEKQASLIYLGQRNFWVDETKREHKKLEDLKAENEKLKNEIMLIIAPKEVGGGIDFYKEGLLAEARKEERAEIFQILQSRLNMIAIETTDLRETMIANLLSGIEPQQSCEGCEHTNKYHNGISANGVCLKCKDFSNYQPKEK